MSDEPSVPIKTWLRPSTYRQFVAHAAQRRITVGELLSRLADASLKPIERTAEVVQAKRVPRPLTPAQTAFIADGTDPRHGTLNGYSNLKCRCDRCKAAAAAYNAGKGQ